VHAGQHSRSQSLSAEQEGAASPCKGRKLVDTKTIYIRASDNVHYYWTYAQKRGQQSPLRASYRDMR
jgi:hypothetical protein